MFTVTNYFHGNQDHPDFRPEIADGERNKFVDPAHFQTRKQAQGYIQRMTNKREMADRIVRVNEERTRYYVKCSVTRISGYYEVTRTD